MLLNCGVGEDSWESLELQGDPSTLKEISPEYSLEGLTLKLKLQYFGYLLQRNDSFEKTLMLGQTEGERRRGQQRIRALDGITNSMDIFEKTPEIRDGQASLVCYSPLGHIESDTTEQLNWTEDGLTPLLWGQSTLTPRKHAILCLLNKTPSHDWAVTLVHRLKLLLWQDKTKEMTHSPDRGT